MDCFHHSRRERPFDDGQLHAAAHARRRAQCDGGDPACTARRGVGGIRILTLPVADGRPLSNGGGFLYYKCTKVTLDFFGKEWGQRRPESITSAPR